MSLVALGLTVYFKKIFLLVAMATRVLHGIYFFSNEWAPPKEHPCEVSSKLAKRLRRRCRLKQLLTFYLYIPM